MVKKIEQLSATIIMSTIVKDFEVMRLGLKLTGVLTHIDFGGVGWLSDYRTSLSLKGERLFHTKNTRLFDDGSQENATAITLRLLADCSLIYDI